MTSELQTEGTSLETDSIYQVVLESDEQRNSSPVRSVIEKFSFKIMDLVKMRTETRILNTIQYSLVMLCIKPDSHVSNHTRLQEIIFSNDDLEIMKITSDDFELFFKQRTKTPNSLVVDNAQQWLLREKFMSLLQGIKTLTIQITGRDLIVNVYVKQ